MTLGWPSGIDIDSEGILYVADALNHRVLKIDSEGFIEVVAGNGTGGFKGDGDSATAASLSYPTDVVAAGDGEIFISDSYNQRVRRVDSKGIISTIAVFDEPTGSLFLHPSGQLVVSMRGGLKLAEIERPGEPAAVKLAANPGGPDANRLRREALTFTPQGDLLFVAAGQLFVTQGGESTALPLPETAAVFLETVTRMAVGANGDLVFCDARQRILRMPAAALDDALTAAGLR